MGDAIRFRILESVSRTPQPQAAPGDPAVELFSEPKLRCELVEVGAFDAIVAF